MSKNEKTPDNLKKLLADYALLALKTQNYHWNVTGPNFSSLHALFEQQYTDLAAAMDEVAERIRALGQSAPGSFAEFLKLATLKEAGSGKLKAAVMVSDLYDDQLTLSKYMKKMISQAAAEGDDVTADLLTGRVAIHEKNAWMLASSQ